MCGINYPVLAHFQTCPIHGEQTAYLNNDEPDEDWQAAHERLIKQAQRDADINDRSFPLIHDVAVIEEGDRYFIDQTTLQLAGVRLSRMQPDQFYLIELDDGWVYEIQGFDEPRRRWWVERVMTAVVIADEIPPFHFIAESGPDDDWEFGGG